MTAEQNGISPAEQVADLIIGAGKVVIFTGAGISTESGIPDFRGPGGIWEKHDPEDFTYQKFVSSTEARRMHWKMLGEGMLAIGADPNAAHLAIVELDRIGKLDCVITQNVDNLHQKAGIPDDRVFELHGNLLWVVCLKCRRRLPFAEIKARVETGEEDPACAVCGGILKPDGVFFGEALPEKVLREAANRSHAARQKGTSLPVPRWSNPQREKKRSNSS